MLDLQPLRQFPNPRTRPFRQSFERQHQLVLMRLDSRIAGRLLTKMQELANLISQLCQRLIVGKPEFFSHVSKLIISYYDVIQNTKDADEKVLYSEESDVADTTVEGRALQDTLQARVPGEIRRTRR